MKKLKYLIVAGLERACGIIHLTYRIPILNQFTRCWLANWSARLDDRWETGAWAQVPDDFDLEAWLEDDEAWPESDD